MRLRGYDIHTRAPAHTGNDGTVYGDRYSPRHAHGNGYRLRKYDKSRKGCSLEGRGCGARLDERVRTHTRVHLYAAPRMYRNGEIIIEEKKRTFLVLR